MDSLRQIRTLEKEKTFDVENILTNCPGASKGDGFSRGGKKMRHYC